MGLTSTTAPGKLFGSRAELADHYKSDWHKYNLKRREANMVMLTFEEFSARLEAALALRQERNDREARSGRDHLKNKESGGVSSSKKKKNAGEKRLSKRQLRQQEKRNIPASTSNDNDEDQDMDEEHENEQEQESIQEEEAPIIDPCQSLFDKHISPDVKTNVEYMSKTHGFFIPDTEYLTDLEGLIGYCAEKIKLGHTCLYCQRTFKTWQGCQQHMINSNHCKLRYEAGVDLEEFDVFYDFTADDIEFLNAGIGNHKKKKGGKKVDDVTTSSPVSSDQPMEITDEGEDEDSDEWEDVDSDDEKEDDGLYAAYEDEVARHGFNISSLGELIFPDGRIIGHRGLKRYYDQRFTAEDLRTSVVAARRARGEMLHNGRVYDTYGMRQNAGGEGNAGQEVNNAGILALKKAGLTMGSVQGRAGKGILVSSGVSGAASFTALSLYRMKAALKKAKTEEFRGRRLQQRTTLPMNKMDKKANRLFNNVSVAHAPR